MLNYPSIFVKLAQAGSFKNTQDLPSEKILFGTILAQPFSQFFQHSASATSEPALNIGLRLKKIPS
jgi:hypothetical protein